MRYKVQFELVLDDNDPSTPDWLEQVIYDNLAQGEDIENFVIEQVV